jgi:hypothetical protein
MGTFHPTTFVRLTSASSVEPESLTYSLGTPGSMAVTQSVTQATPKGLT